MDELLVELTAVISSRNKWLPGGHLSGQSSQCKHFLPRLKLFLHRWPRPTASSYALVLGIILTALCHSPPRPVDPLGLSVAGHIPIVLVSLGSKIRSLVHPQWSVSIKDPTPPPYKPAGLGDFLSQATLMLLKKLGNTEAG